MMSPDSDKGDCAQDFYAKLKVSRNDQKATDEIDLDMIQNYTDETYDDIFRGDAGKDSKFDSRSTELPLEGQKRSMILNHNLDSRVSWAHIRKCVVLIVTLILVAVVAVGVMYEQNQGMSESESTSIDATKDTSTDQESLAAEEESKNLEDEKTWKTDVLDYYLTNVGHEGSQSLDGDLLEDRFIDISIPLNVEMKRMLPFYWHIPRTGGTSLQDMLTKCNNLVEANEIGITGGHKDDTQLEIIQKPSGRLYVNVDMSTEEGVQRAIDLNFVSSGLADVVVSTRINIASRVFDPPVHRGICFTMLRHPVARAISLFYHLQAASWEDTYHQEWQNMTIEDYARSGKVESNWITRALNQKLHGGALGYDDLQRAKDFLRRKCIIGLTEDFANSLLRFDSVFQWNGRSSTGDRKCVNEMMMENTATPTSTSFDETSQIYDILAKHNEYDIELYKYAQELYGQQSALIG